MQPNEDLGALAFQKVVNGEGLTPEESAALQRHHGVLVQPTVESLQRVLKTQDAPTSAENVDQKEGVHRAAEKAVELGIVRQEILPSERSGAPVTYLLSSAHYNPDLSKSEDDFGERSQRELFRFLHLACKEGSVVPLFVEGSPKVRTTPIGFYPMRPQIVINGQLRDIHDPIVQERLFADDALMAQIMEEHRQAADVQGWKAAPKFYQYAPYPSILGVETDTTQHLGNTLIRTWIPWEKQFEAKYESFRKSGESVGGGSAQFEIETGWGTNDGVPMLRLGGGWGVASAVAAEMEAYLRMAAMWEDFCSRMESEMAEAVLMHEGTSIAYMGKAHELKLAEKLRAQREVRVLTPRSSTSFDDKRRVLKDDDPKSKRFRIDLASQLLAIARMHAGTRSPK